MIIWKIQSLLKLKKENLLDLIFWQSQKRLKITEMTGLKVHLLLDEF